MSDHHEKVLQFHRALGSPAPSSFTFDEFRADLRVRLIDEELSEFAVAAREKDPVELIDAICDILYVTYGAATELGISPQQLDAFFDEVHRTNMAKAGTDGKIVERMDGKVMKPLGWKPPDIKTLFDRMLGEKK